MRYRYGLGRRFVNCNMGKKCQVFAAAQGGLQRDWGQGGGNSLPWEASQGLWSGIIDGWGAGNPPLDLYLIPVTLGQGAMGYDVI